MYNNKHAVIFRVLAVWPGFIQFILGGNIILNVKSTGTTIVSDYVSINPNLIGLTMVVIGFSGALASLFYPTQDFHRFVPVFALYMMPMFFYVASLSVLSVWRPETRELSLAYFMLYITLWLIIISAVKLYGILLSHEEN